MPDYFAKYSHIMCQIRGNPFVARFLRVFRYLVDQSRFSLYIRTLLNTVMEAAILLFIVYLGCILLLYLSHMMWELYQQTPMGSRFVVLFDDQAGAIKTIMALEFWRFAWKITVSSFTICIGVSAMCWFFPIGRNFYLPMGPFAKVLFWGLPLSAVVSLYISKTLGVSSLSIIFIFTLAPTMFLFMSCFTYTGRLVPELGDVVSEVWRCAKECTLYIKNRIE